MYAAAKSLHSCLTLCDPIDGSPPGSPVPGILQARTLEWVAISFSNAWKWKAKVKSLSRARLFATPWTAAHQAPPSMGFSRQEHWSGAPVPAPILEYSQLTTLWQFQANSKGTQSYIYIYPFFLMWVHSCLACTNRQHLFTQLRNKIYQEFHKLTVTYVCYPVWGCCFTMTPWKYLFDLLILYFYPTALFPNLYVNCNFLFQYWSFGWSFWNISKSS